MNTRYHDTLNAINSVPGSAAVERTGPITARLAALGAGALRGRCFRPTHHTTPVRTAGPAIAHCQPPVWMMSAPSVGPDAPPMVVHADHNVMALTRSFAAVTSSNKPIDAGALIAAPAPCTTRPAISNP